MKKKVYVVFQDHYDKNTDYEWHEYDNDLYRQFVTVKGSEGAARRAIEDWALSDYYEYLDMESNIDIYLALGWDWNVDHTNEFEIAKDEGSSITVNINGNKNIYYYEEYEIDV